MRYFLSAIILLATLVGCAMIRPVPVQTEIRYEIRDSLNLRDSTVLIPIEVVKDMVPPYDTLKMETTMAKAQAWVDTTTHTLKGALTNKQGVQYKYVYRDKIQYRDSLVYKEVPVEVEKIVKTHYPYEKWLWIYVILSLVLAATYICIKRTGL